LLASDSFHDAVRLTAPLFEHEMVCTALDRVAEECSATNYFVHEVSPLPLKHKQRGSANDGQRDGGHHNHQFDAQPSAPTDTDILQQCAFFHVLATGGTVRGKSADRHLPPFQWRPPAHRIADFHSTLIWFRVMRTEETLICVSPITLALCIPAHLQKMNGFRIDWWMGNSARESEGSPAHQDFDVKAHTRSSESLF